MDEFLLDEFRPKRYHVVPLAEDGSRIVDGGSIFQAHDVEEAHDADEGSLSETVDMETGEVVPVPRYVLFAVAGPTRIVRRDDLKEAQEARDTYLAAMVEASGQPADRFAVGIADRETGLVDVGLGWVGSDELDDQIAAAEGKTLTEEDQRRWTNTFVLYIAKLFR